MAVLQAYISSTGYAIYIPIGIARYLSDFLEERLKDFPTLEIKLEIRVITLHHSEIHPCSVIGKIDKGQELMRYWIVKFDIDKQKVRSEHRACIRYINEMAQ